MYTLLVVGIISVCLGLEGHCGFWLYQYMIDRSEQKAEKRRAATRPRIYRQVHDEWTKYRNRRDLWEKLDK